MWMVRCSDDLVGKPQLSLSHVVDAGTSTSFAAVSGVHFWFVMVDVLTAHGNLLCHSKLA
jgi:hypothetical protein